MKVILILVTISSLLLLNCAPRETDETAHKNAALEASLSWLVIVDSGEYGRSWDEAAVLFRDVISRQHWVQTLEQARSPLGELLSREVLSVQYTTELPDAPEGEYVIIQFESAFTNYAEAIETLTPMLQEDGSWRVSGYYIR